MLDRRAFLGSAALSAIAAGRGTAAPAPRAPALRGHWPPAVFQDDEAY